MGYRYRPLSRCWCDFSLFFSVFPLFSLCFTVFHIFSLFSLTGLEGVAYGERFYGYMPMSRFVVLQVRFDAVLMLF